MLFWHPSVVIGMRHPIVVSLRMPPLSDPDHFTNGITLAEAVIVHSRKQVGEGSNRQDACRPARKLSRRLHLLDHAAFPHDSLCLKCFRGYSPYGIDPTQEIAHDVLQRFLRSPAQSLQLLNA